MKLSAAFAVFFVLTFSADQGYGIRCLACPDPHYGDWMDAKNPFGQLDFCTEEEEAEIECIPQFDTCGVVGMDSYRHECDRSCKVYQRRKSRDRPMFCALCNKPFCELF